MFILQGRNISPFYHCSLLIFLYLDIVAYCTKYDLTKVSPRPFSISKGMALSFRKNQVLLMMTKTVASVRVGSTSNENIGSHARYLVMEGGGGGREDA
jgi:hypothetical protein